MKWLQIKNKAENSPDIEELFIYGEIGDWWDSLDASSLADKLKAHTGTELNVRINSGGGEVFTAQAFHSLLRSSGKKINVFIDGLAASAATIIACAGDVVTMPAGAMYMVHSAMSATYGNAAEMRTMADTLDKVTDGIKATYKQRTNLDDEKINDLMSKDSWLTAQEAKDLGFIDNILDVAVAATTKDVITGSKLKNIPMSFENAVKSVKETKEVIKPMDLQSFKADHSALAEQFRNEISANHKAEIKAAVDAERQRIVDINETAGMGHEELASEAIKNGLSAGDFAIQAMKAEKQKGADVLNKANQDRQVLANVSTPAVDPTPAPAETEEDKILNALDASFE